MAEPISLSEKIYLFAINPQNGGIFFSLRTVLEFTIPGCILLEMHENNLIYFSENKLILKQEQTSNPIYRMIIAKIVLRSAPRSICRWISILRFAQQKTTKIIQEQLVKKRIIRMEKRSFLLFQWEIPILVQKEVQYAIKTEINSLITNGIKTDSERHLLSIASSREFLHKLYPERSERRLIVEKLKTTNIQNPVSIAVTKAIKIARATAAVSVS